MKPLFDANILIDYLWKHEKARQEFELYPKAAISIISWIDVLAGASEAQLDPLRRFLGRFDQIGIDPDIAEQAAAVRRERRIKLPDAVIWATAQSRSLLLVTRNSRDFPEAEPWVRIPYRLG